MTIKCKVEGCEKAVGRPRKQLCEMHYMRQRRGGTFERRRNQLDYLESSEGYLLHFNPSHPLAQAKGYVYVQREVAWAKYGPGDHPCSLCGVVLSWPRIHADHIDDDRLNNEPGNIRILCISCNTRRSERPITSRNGHARQIEIDGETKTSTEWVRHSDCDVSVSTINRRLKAGWKSKDAVFKPSRTRKGKGWGCL